MSKIMEKIAIIGGGISGLTVANLLKARYDVTIFEKEMSTGGLIRCERINGILFHTCGGHVFNSKRQDVLNWFWGIFNREQEFSMTNRNSVVYMEDGLKIPYPIENHIYLFDKESQNKIIEDLLSLVKNEKYIVNNFEDFLRHRFGETLYKKYFEPYNKKIWRRDLKNVPLTWLEGKLPMPTVQEIIFNNFNHVEEKAFVHSTFWYEKYNGSQYIVDKLSEGLNIHYNSNITNIKLITHPNRKWLVDGFEFDKVVYCGNIKNMIKSIEGVDVSAFVKDIDALQYHGTTTVLCEIDKNDYSWIYQPSSQHNSHRIICTGNFSPSNNGTTMPEGRISATIEFTDEISKDDIEKELKNIPLNPQYITHKYNKYTYPIQYPNTQDVIKELKKALVSKGFYFTGRFADWEYYNMDVAIGAAMDLCKHI